MFAQQTRMEYFQSSSLPCCQPPFHEFQPSFHDPRQFIPMAPLSQGYFHPIISQVQSNHLPQYLPVEKQQDAAMRPSDDCSFSKRHGRAILTEKEAQDIFKYKPATSSKEKYSAAVLARFYGVSVKTVRDIWVGRTWYRSTFHLDPSKPILADRLEKKPGRPRGAKDSKPRIRTLYRADNGSPSDNQSGRLEESLAPEAESKPSFYACLAGSIKTATPVSDAQSPSTDVESEGTPPPLDADSRIGSPYADRDGAGAAAGEGWPEVTSDEFSDPFHNDWAFWPKSEDAEAAMCGENGKGEMGTERIEPA